MSSPSQIHYLKRKELDVTRWDRCIDDADNGLIYAYSFYLDAMCDNWDALVFGDYQAVMPLPWRKKWGVKYVYQPAFIQRLGVFGEVAPDLYNVLYHQASKRFSLLHYNVSELVSMQKATLKKRSNFFIDLNQSYEQVRLHYHEECINNIEKSKRRGCVFTNEISAENVIHFFRAAYGVKNSGLLEIDYKKFSELLEEAQKRNSVRLLGVCNTTNDLIYSAAIFQDKRRLYYVLGAPTSEGREKRATYFFIDQLLKAHSNTELLFDFEGSDIPSVASFYQKFRPQTEYYYELKMKKFF